MEKLTVVHEEGSDHYTSVLLFKHSEAAYEYLLERVEELAEEYLRGPEGEWLWISIKAEDGKAALQALQDLYNEYGCDVFGGTFLWVTEEPLYE